MAIKIRHFLLFPFREHRQAVCALLFALLAHVGLGQPPQTKNALDAGCPPKAAPFFLLNDNRATFAYQANATQPGSTRSTAKQIFEIYHFDVWRYGTNLAVVDLLKSDRSDPASPCLSPAGPTTGCVGATEVYGFFRSSVGLNEILGTRAFAKGPLRDVSMLVGADIQKENRYSSAYKHDVVAGLQLALDLPDRGYLNVSPLYYKEANHNAYALCDGNGVPGENCLRSGDLSYRGTWALETSYYMELDFLPTRMRNLAVRGRVNLYGPKGDENSPLPSTPTKVEIDSEPVRLIFDTGKAIWGLKRSHMFDVWVAYRYWGNKYGFDPNTSPVCTGAGAGSCVEKSFYPGITVKF